MKKKSSSRFFSLLEVMISICLLALGAGALFFKVNALIEQKQFETDSRRLKNLLLSSRTLALNTRTDWRLIVYPQAERWALQLVCREDPDLIYPPTYFSKKELTFNQKTVKNFFIDFYSTGKVSPSGTICLKKKGREVSFTIPQLFDYEENGKIPPFHP